MSLQTIKLSQIDPSPFRDFKLFPIDDEQVGRLLASINDTGFWGGMQVRSKPGVAGRYELAFGHHRLEAAKRRWEIQRRYDTISAEVRSIDDDEMVRLLTAENATQRQDNAAATLDAVASICRRICYLLLRYEWKGCSTIVEHWAPDDATFQELREKLLRGKGLGEPVITSYSKGTLTLYDIKSALSTLKASGELGRLVADQQVRVDTEIAEETRLAEEAAKQAERDAAARRSAKAEADATAKRKAAEAAKTKETETKEATAKSASSNAKDTIFDVSCASLFKNRYQLDAFRKCVTAEHMRALVPLKGQRALALAIVEKARKVETDTTAEFIRQCVAEVALRGANVERDVRDRALKANDAAKLQDAFNHLRFAVSEWGKGSNAIIEVATRRGALSEALEAKFINHVASLRAHIRKVADKMGIDVDDLGARVTLEGRVNGPTKMIQGA